MKTRVRSQSARVVLAMAATTMLAALAPVPLAAQTSRTLAETAAADLSGLGLGFGSAVAIVGDEAFVGRTGEASGLPMNPTRPGGVHVFRLDRASGTWQEVAHVSDESVDIGDGFGMALGDTADLDGVLGWAARPVVKFAEAGLVLMLSLHLFGGLRLLVLEFLPWRPVELIV